jgi:hypothetical protein
MDRDDDVVVNLIGRRSSKAAGDMSVVVAVARAWKKRRGRRRPLPWRIRSKGYRADVLVVGPQLLGFGQVSPFPFFCSNSFSFFWVKF